MSNVEGCDLAIQFGVKFTETSPGILHSFNICFGFTEFSEWICIFNSLDIRCGLKPNFRRNGPPCRRVVGGDGDAGGFHNFHNFSYSWPA